MIDNITICRQITRQIQKSLRNTTDISITITEYESNNANQREYQKFTGTIRTQTKTQTYTGIFQAETQYKPLLHTLFNHTPWLYIRTTDIQIRYLEVKPT